MTLFIAVVCGLLYFAGTSRMGYGLGTATGSPIVLGFILGMLYGDVSTGLIIGANIQLVYLGIIATGGNIPADQTLAGVIAIPIALQLGMDANTAVGLAVPFGILGVFLDQIRRTSNSIWVQKADKLAASGNDKQIFHCAFTYPAIFALVLRFIPVFIINLFGASAVTWAMEALPSWVIGGFKVAGGILPAMGFAIIIMTIGNKRLMPFFFLGFFAVAYLKINIMAAAIFGTCIALLSYFSQKPEDDVFSAQEDAQPGEKTYSLSNKDLWNTYMMWFFSTELSNSYERLQALAFCNALSKRLKKLCKNNFKGYTEALTRHLQFYNSEGTIGCIIHGIALSMEEQRSKGEPVPGEMITGIKTGLMGPLAGIGDTLIWGTLKPIILGLGCSFALSSNALGAVIPFLYPIIMVIIGYNLLKMGYLVGKESVMRLINNGAVNQIITATGVLGLFMMGSLSSTYIKVSTPLKFAMANTQPIVLQEIFDQIIPGLLPLVAIFAIYWYFKKIGQRYNKVVLFVLVMSMVASFLGVLG